MRKKLLKQVLSIPTYFGKEDRIRDFLIDYGIKNGIRVNVDPKGNVYLIKGVLGENETYPCVIAHIDTVHRDQVRLVENNEKLIIHEDKIDGDSKLWASLKDGKNEIITGIGGDDKAGVFICLELIQKYDKIIGAFFVEEEFGCKGSLAADIDILKDVGYFIQFDAPTDNWCSFTCAGTQLFNESIFNKVKPVLAKHKITRISMDPYTDILRMRQHFDVACFNFFAGYQRMHSNEEFVLVSHINKAITLGTDMIKLLGLEKYDFVHKGGPDIDLFNETKIFTKLLLAD